MIDSAVNQILPKIVSVVARDVKRIFMKGCIAGGCPQNSAFPGGLGPHLTRGSFGPSEFIPQTASQLVQSF